MLDWFRDNKDALLAIAVLASPIVAMFGTLLAALLSFRAVTAAPRVQREIAQETAKMTQEIARNTLQMTQAQITASLFGAADHQWITDFRVAIAEVLALGMERRSDRTMATLSPERTSTHTHRYATALMQIRLMAWDDAAGTELQNLIAAYIGTATIKPDASPKEISAAADALIAKAAEVIRRREARLATYASRLSA
jgi:hypothetical protein